MKKKIAALTLFISTLMVSTTIYAASDNVFVSGTKAFLDDVIKWLLILIPASAAVAIAWQSWLKNSTEEPAEIAAKNKLIKKYLVGAVIGVSAVGLVSLVLSYYNAGA
ncbi:conjugal transfer protein [Brevibacillus porteri]|uniref:conjugal transfer protein n=1 Tax=Brevibacillus porteri TaxID=2126350 RepID=UPI003D1918D2